MDPAAPNSPFKWESASGLEHSCFLCSMKMSNPKARQTCYGTHSIPCYRYHQTMHAIGTSHNCFSCIQADELHEGRHRKIAELLAEYKAATTGSQGRSSLEEMTLNIPRHQLQQGQGQLYPIDIDRHQDREGEEGDDSTENDDSQTATDTGASSAGDAGVAPPKLTKAEARTMKKAAKAQKSQFKAFKNQQRHVIGVRTEDVILVGTVLHGEGTKASQTHPLATDKTIEEVIARNVGFMSNIEDHKKALLSSIVQRRRNNRERRRSAMASAHGGTLGSAKNRRYSQAFAAEEEVDDDLEDLLVAALCKLGVDPAHIRSGSGSGAGSSTASNNGGSSSTKKSSGSGGVSPQQIVSLVANMKALVRDDLERFENEQRETCIRAGGFWRYVGRPVFERMTTIARELDWKTGMKLKEQKD